MTESFEPIRFGRYQLLERIAVGGMAEIFKAKAYGAHGFEKIVAIKRILPNLAVDSEFVEMFITEAKVMVQLNHPKVVQVLDFGQVEQHYYIAMEYVQGIDGLALLRACARLHCRPTTVVAVHIVAELLDGLDYAHRLKDASGRFLNIVHRDISPSNIFLSDLGEVKIGDFGIARVEVRRRHTETGALKGKYGYMAPEVVSGDSVDHRSDLFSVGVVLAELLMIRRLFIAKSDLEVLLQVRDARLDRLDKYGGHIPHDLRKILENALARDPAARYQDAATFRDALHRFLFDQKRMIRGTDVRNFLERLREMGAESVEGTPTAKWGTSSGLESRLTTPHSRAPSSTLTPSRALAPTKDLTPVLSSVQAPPPAAPESALSTAPPPSPPPTPKPTPAAPASEAKPPAEALRPPPPEANQAERGLDPSLATAALRSPKAEGTEYSAHTRERIKVKSSASWKVSENLLEPDQIPRRPPSAGTGLKAPAERLSKRERGGSVRRASSGAGLKVPAKLEEEVRQASAKASPPAEARPRERITREAEVPPELLQQTEGARPRRNASVGLKIPRELLEQAPPALRDLLSETGPQPGLIESDFGEPSLEELAASVTAKELGAAVGKKRRPPLGPPPKPEPIPVGLAEIGEAQKCDPMVLPVDELERESSSTPGRDFQTADHWSPVASPAERPNSAASSANDAASAATRGTPPKPTPDLQGHLGRHSLVKLLFRFAVAEETGLLALNQGERTKEIYLVDGDPEFVTSNLPDELFGQYLVQKGVISEGELSMVLAMLPHFEGKLGNALVALKLLQPMQVLRHLTNQVRHKLLNAFEWSEGTFAFYQGVRCEQESAPLGLDAFEVIGAGVLALSPLTVEQRVQPLLGQAPRSVSPPPVPPEAFRLGPRPRQVFDSLDGRRQTGEQLKRFDDQEQRDHWARMVYLLVEVGLAKV